MKRELSSKFAGACVLSWALVACSSAPLAPGQENTGTGAQAGSSAGAPATPAITSDWVDYPAGPYGTHTGAVIQNFEFLGWRQPDIAAYDATKVEKIRLSDFYNPDGRSDVKLLAVNASAVWCSVCRAEYQDMNDNQTYATYRAKGVEILGTLFQDASYFPAQPSDLSLWGKVSTHQVKFPLVLDPGFKLGAFFDSDATPLNMVIDVRTMKIVSITMGYSTDYWTKTVQGLLNKQ